MPPRPRFLLGTLAFALVAPLAAAAAKPPVSPAEATRWLEGYLRIDSTTPRGEAIAASYLAAILHREGIGTRLLVTPEGRTSLLAELPATVPGATEGVLLLHHLDVVPAEGRWQRPPFGGETADGMLWGRGAVDSKSLGVAQLAALVGIRRQGLPRQRRVLYLAAADEESGGLRGTGWALARYPDLFGPLVGVLNEGGAAKRINGRLLWWEVEVTQKRPLWLQATARGRAGHAAGHQPKSAVHDLLEGLGRIIARPPSYRVTPAAREYLAALAPHQNPHWRGVFSRVDRIVGPEGFREPLMPGMSTLFVDTVQVTVLDGAQRINVIPGEASAQIDVRMLPDSDGEALLADLRERAGRGVELEVLVTAPPAPPSPRKGPVWDALVATLGREAPVVPAFKSGFSDSRFFRERGIPAYGIGPFALEPQVLLGVHGVDERLPLDELARGTARVTAILQRLVAPAVPAAAGR